MIMTMTMTIELVKGRACGSWFAGLAACQADLQRGFATRTNFIFRAERFGNNFVLVQHETQPPLTMEPNPQSTKARKNHPKRPLDIAGNSRNLSSGAILVQ